MADNHYRCDRCGAATFTGRCAWCDTARETASSGPATASEGATGLTGDESYPGDPCPEHGPHCHGASCCCADKHRPAATGVTSSDGERGLSEEERMAAISDEVVRVAEDVWSEDEPTLAEYELTERILAARTAQPEGVERVEWGVRVTTERRTWDQRERSEEWARAEVARLWSHLATVVGPNGLYNGQRFRGAELINRTVTEYAPVVGPWEVVGDE